MVDGKKPNSFFSKFQRSRSTSMNNEYSATCVEIVRFSWEWTARIENSREMFQVLGDQHQNYDEGLIMQ